MVDGPIMYQDGEAVEILGSPENSEDEYIDWESNGNMDRKTRKEVDEYLDGLISNNGYSVNGGSTSTVSYTAATSNFGGIFGMPYQFSAIVDPPMDSSDAGGTGSSNPYKIGRKFNDKIFSLMPVLFLCPGEPRFMQGYNKKHRRSMAKTMANVMGGQDDTSAEDFDDGRFYSFTSNFEAYKNYANTALRALALYMGIGDAVIPVPGGSRTVKLKNIKIESFMNNDFTKLYGTHCVVPFFLDAATSITESFSNNTTESMVSSTVNGLSQTAKEIQFIVGNGNKSLVKNLASGLAELGTSAIGGLSDLVDGIGNQSFVTKMVNELTTIVSGGKIVFPEIWSDSSYDHTSYTINLKLRSPDPDPISIFLNIYMPIILLISMTAPRQIGNSSNSYESPFLVRATYKSIFSCDLGIISSLSIDKGSQGSWNVMGQPITADVSVEIKDLYGSMMVSKSLGLISNTAQMDYLATMAGLDLNEYEPLRMIKLWSQIIGDKPRDWANDLWGGFRRSLSVGTTRVLRKFTDTRFLGY